MISKIIYRQGCKIWKTRLPSFMQNLDLLRKTDKSLHRFGKNKWPEFPEGKEIAQSSSSTFKRKSNMPIFCVDTLIDSNDCNQSMLLSLVVSPLPKRDNYQILCIWMTSLQRLRLLQGIVKRVYKSFNFVSNSN